MFYFTAVCRSAPRWLFGISLGPLIHPSAAAAANSAQQQQQQPLLNPTGPWGGNSCNNPQNPGWGGSGNSQNPGPQPLALIAANKEPLVLTLASFAVTKLAYVRLTKLFREKYLAEKGVDVRFRLTFAGSGVQVGSW